VQRSVHLGAPQTESRAGRESGILGELQPAPRADRYALSAAAEDGWATREPLAVADRRVRAGLTVGGLVIALDGQSLPATTSSPVPR